jgi:ubiquinone/menaquinone biosynthesis C-methylase UbiE
MTDDKGAQFQKDSAQLYSSKAQKYARYRPDFDSEAIASFVEISGLPHSCTVADIGSGTGMLARHLLDHFETVYAVEPNESMRLVAEANLGKRPGFHSLAGPAEKIPLPKNSVDLISAGQAIHWFDPQKALDEFHRIARPGAWLLLAHIKSLDEDLNESLTPLWTEENGCLPKAQQPRSFDVHFSDFFAGGNYQQHPFPHTHPETWESFLGGLESASYAPDEDHLRYENFVNAARQIFDRFSQESILHWQIATEISCGRLKA